jgi:hypothetical protein
MSKEPSSINPVSPLRERIVSAQAVEAYQACKNVALHVLAGEVAPAIATVNAACPCCTGLLAKYAPPQLSA